MSRRCAFFVLALVTVLAIAQTPADAVFIYDEAVHGDLSDDRFAPTPLLAEAGVNALSGTVVTLAGVADRDYFTVTIPAGLQLDALVLSSYTGDDLSFLGMQAGTTLTEPPIGTDPGQLLGWVHLTSRLIGTDLLLPMSQQPGVIGFETPLPSAPYTFWAQETSSNLATYSLSLNVSAVPGPPSLSLAGLAALAALSNAWRRRRRGRPIPTR
jgi:hypothetical protein